MKPGVNGHLSDLGEWTEALASRGIGWAEDQGQRGGMGLRRSGNWLSLETPALPRRAGPPEEDLEHPGLWKQVGGQNQSRSVFEFPALVATAEVETAEASENSSPAALLDWALATAQDQLPVGWAPPPEEFVTTWMPPGALTVRSGFLVRQGELILTRCRWALRFPILPVVAPDLPAERRQALDRLATDAQSRVRMIRAGWTKSVDGLALVAALDLSGAPHSPALFLAGLEGLTHAVASLAETASLLADVAVTLRSLEVCRLQTKRERNEV